MVFSERRDGLCKSTSVDPYPLNPVIPELDAETFKPGELGLFGTHYGSYPGTAQVYTFPRLDGRKCR